MTASNNTYDSASEARGFAKNIAVSVLLADDHKMISEALKAMLEHEDEFRVELTNSLDATLSALRSNPKGFRLVLLDVSMPGMQGLRSIKQVVDATLEGSVVVFSGTSDYDFVWQAIELGAKGFISKEQALRSLPGTLRLIADGHEFLPLSLSRHKVESNDQDTGFADRDRLILRAVSEGKTNKEIAIEVGLTEIAIKMKMRGICSRLGARNRAHAVIVATQKGII